MEVHIENSIRCNNFSYVKERYSLSYRLIIIYPHANVGGWTTCPSTRFEGFLSNTNVFGIFVPMGNCG